MLVLRIVLQNITKPLDSLGNGRNPLASVNHNVLRCPPNAWENCSSAEKKARPSSPEFEWHVIVKASKKKKRQKKVLLLIPM
jgi:hypothetical protein